MPNLPRAIRVCNASLSMNELLWYLDKWKSSKSRIFGLEDFAVSITGELGDQVKFRHIELSGNGLLARATIRENGVLVVRALDVKTEKKL